MFRRILLGYNDSPGARQALAEALQLTQQQNARLIVLAVEEQLPRYDGATLGEVRDEHERNQRDCRRWLRTAEAHAHECGVPIRTEIRVGSLTRQLASAAAVHRADLVVVGRADHRSIWARLASTKSGKVSRRVGCPVLIAPAPRRPAS